jgi:excisionase family DNA binding protein
MQMLESNTNDVRMLNREDAARFLLISTRNLDYLREAGKLPFVRIGRRVGFLRHDLERFVEARRIAA